MKIKRLDLKKQWRNEEKELLPILNKVLSSGIYVGGKHVDSLEKKLAKYCGTKYSVCTNSGTDALTLALYVLGVQRGDEVITQSNSFVASASCISHLGATPIFADVDIATFELVNGLKYDVSLLKSLKGSSLINNALPSGQSTSLLIKTMVAALFKALS